MKKKNKRLCMRKIKEICRMRLKMGLGINQIAGACNISTSMASTYVNKIEELSLSYEDLSSLDKEEIYKGLFPDPEDKPVLRQGLPDFEYLTRPETKNTSKEKHDSAIRGQALKTSTSGQREE